MTELQFDKELHTYKHNGRRLLSVTQVLPDIPEHLLYKQFFIEKTLLGSRVHETVDLINKQILYGFGPEYNKDLYLDRHTDSPDDLPYIHAYYSFLAEHKPKIENSELKSFHPVWGYAGTMDLIVHLFNKKFVVDVKTSTSIAPYARLQLAAYQELYNANNSDKVVRRAVLQLKPTMQYSIVSYMVKDQAVDFDIFLCKLKSAKWDSEFMS